ncbi:hypothetical protein BJP34_19730 [Moorena producens PAL-8-15-08-1]|uniref:Uncharacterized protein n=1 Tax=Moorena producens PAL-8-15-08-1 TaxID=1458985 RepID=A0A1D8TUP5_9CYAN|nr:hypothetical protein [Moorena producens]AOX01371.1 hypothetical protein BJP34_19730 [Moorena producens PAL-8-15-08-1]
MKPTLTKILPRFGKQTSLALTALALTVGIVSNVQAQSLTFVDNTNSSKRFFEEGRELFDTELKNLVNNNLSSADTILEISDEVINREDLLELENPQQLLNDGESLQ